MAQRRLDAQVIDLERVVLAQVTAYGAAPALETAGLRPAHFGLPEHQALWRVALELLSAGQPVDAVTLFAALAARGERGWTLTQVTSLDQGVPRAASEVLASYVERLVGFAAHRSVLAEARQLVSTLETDGDALGSESLDASLSRIDAARQATVRERLWFTATDAQGLYEAELARRTGGEVFLGVPALDAQFGGFGSGEVVGLMARPGMGKTVLLCHQARYSGGEGIGHVVFSLEMPGAQIVGRLAQGVFGIGRKELAYRTHARSLDWSLYRQSLATVTVVDRQGLSVADMSTILRRLQEGPMRDTPIRAVTIDHLGLVAGHDRHEEYTRVSRIARELKDFAKRHGVVVMLAIQVNRDAGGDGSKRLHLGSARDSGVVEEAVDYLLAFRRFDRTETQPEHVRSMYKNVLFLSAPKVRHEDPSQDEVAVQYDHTLVVVPAPDMSIPETADTPQSRVAHFGGRR